MTIRFGTDGWRGIIADEFTFDNVRAVAQAVAAVIRQTDGSGKPVPVGHDVRFLGPRFAEVTASILEGNGIPTVLADGPVTTPMVSCQVVASGAPLGVCITASHNPATWNGFKLKAAFGGSAPPELTARVEALLGRTPPRTAQPPATRQSFLPAYLPRLGAVVDRGVIRRAPLRVVVDSMHGSGGRILEGFLKRGRTRIETVRALPDPLFGGTPPEPRPENLGPLREAVVRVRAHIGIATDGDGDRIGVCDETGRVLSPFQIFSLVALHLIENRKWTGGIARTFANTLVAERIARRFNRPFYDLPIGFKHIAALMRHEDILIGGEESGGIGVKNYLPERDGILIGLVLLEMLAVSERRLTRAVARVEKEYGRFAYRRVDLPVERAQEGVRGIRDDPPARLAGIPVERIDSLDGVKLLLGEAGWILFRASGTEPLLRVYCEARNEALVDALIAAGLRRLAVASAPAPAGGLSAGRASRSRSRAGRRR